MTSIAQSLSQDLIGSACKVSSLRLTADSGRPGLGISEDEADVTCSQPYGSPY